MEGDCNQNGSVKLSYLHGQHRDNQRSSSWPLLPATHRHGAHDTHAADKGSWAPRCCGSLGRADHTCGGTQVLRPWSSLGKHPISCWMTLPQTPTTSQGSVSSQGLLVQKAQLSSTQKGDSEFQVESGHHHCPGLHSVTAGTQSSCQPLTSPRALKNPCPDQRGRATSSGGNEPDAKQDAVKATEM